MPESKSCTACDGRGFLHAMTCDALCPTIPIPCPKCMGVRETRYLAVYGAMVALLVRDHMQVKGMPTQDDMRRFVAGAHAFAKDSEEAQ